MNREEDPMNRRSPWVGAVVVIAGLGATCFAMHAGQVGWGVWFCVVTAVGLGALTKAMG